MLISGSHFGRMTAIILKWNNIQAGLYINIFFNLSLRTTNKKKYLSDSFFQLSKMFFLIKMIKMRELLSAICVKCFGYCLTNMISLYQIFGLVKIPFSPDRTEFHRTEKISRFSCSGCFQPRATNFPFLVSVMPINCIYIFLNIVC